MSKDVETCTTRLNSCPGISYGSRLTFIDADTKAESDAEDGDEVLGRIQLDS